MKVSIIIPVYNTEKYLKRCIESCLNQSLEDIEIILIDDCSQDESRNIIKEYSVRYPNKVKYIFQEENHRQGAARNRGIEIAQGEYLVFVDSDDWIEPDMCESLYKKAKETNADMVGSNYFLSWDCRDEVKKVDITPDLCGTMDKYKKGEYTKKYGMFWTRIYKSSFLKESKLKFPEDIFYEDAFFNFYSVLYSNRIEHINKELYHYYQENQSTVRNRNNPKQYERIKLAEEILRYGKKQKELTEYREIIEYKYLYMQGANLIYTCMGLFDKPDKGKMKSIDKGIKRADLYNSRPYTEISEEFRFFLKLNRASPKVCILFFKYGIYYKLKRLSREK